MASEHIDYGYTGHIAVPSEIRNIKSAAIKIGGIPLTLKQLGLITVAFGAGFIVMKVFNAIGLGDFSVVAVIFAAAVPLAFAFLHMVYRSNKFLSAPVRKNDMLKEYEKLEDLYDKTKQKNAAKEHRKEKTKGKRTYSQYKRFL
jgi:hypothetical protein